MGGLRCFVFILVAVIGIFAIVGVSDAGNNADVTIFLDLITDGGKGNETNDNVNAGTIADKGTTIALELFAHGVNTALVGMSVKFDFNASLVSFVKVENSEFSLSIPEGTVGANLASTSPVTLPPSGFLARAEFVTVVDVTGREFSLGIESVTLAESATLTDKLTTSPRIEFNSTRSADFDGDGLIGFPDFLVLASVFGTAVGDDKYNATQDLDDNGRIDFGDFLLFVQQFGNTVTRKIKGPDLIVESPSASRDTVSTGATFTLTAKDIQLCIAYCRILHSTTLNS